MWYTYILKSGKGRWYYVGSTNDVERRLDEHNNGKVRSTKFYQPFTIVFKKEFVREAEAREYERRIKKQRILKESIIRQIEKLCGIV